MGITLGNLLEEIKYGKDFVDSKNTINEVNQFVDEDYNIFLAGKRSMALLEECDTSKPFIKKLARASRNYIEFENKILSANDVSSVYAKMKMDSIVEDVNSAIDMLSKDPKVLRESNKEMIAKAIATLSVGTDMLGESTISGKRRFKEAKETLQVYINKEYSIIAEMI